MARRWSRQPESSRRLVHRRPSQEVFQKKTAGAAVCSRGAGGRAEIGELWWGCP